MVNDGCLETGLEQNLQRYDGPNIIRAVVCDYGPSGYEYAVVFFTVVFDYIEALKIGWLVGS